MVKVLFLIHDLGQGGAEKVLVNLVNNMDKSKFDITVIAIFGGGVNEQFLNPDIHFRAIFPKEFPGNSKVMKLLTPRQLHKLCVKEEYDIEVSYLEGPSARVISGCTNPRTKLISWIHVEQHTLKKLSSAFRNVTEAKKCYERFNQTVCVSEYVRDDFCSILDFKKPCDILYNTVESDEIIEKSKQEAKGLKEENCTRLVAVGTLKKSKGYYRLLSIIKRLLDENYSVHLYILGIGPMQKELEVYVQDNELDSCVTFLGYQTNPYQYVAKCDLFVCSSFAEGFSTAVTEALILGKPVCTVDVSGMKELLGENNEYGVVTANNEESLYCGIKKMLDNKAMLESYAQQAKVRGGMFETSTTVVAVEEMLTEVCGGK